ncbi:MAG TPA: hypothetical protein VNJ07_12490 [Chitinophagales bacterium]|nr:hypothetical protein [Chitinophagales bacterium]
MSIEQLRPGVFQVTLHGYELAALVSAARWIADGAEGEVSPEAKSQLKRVMTNYNEAIMKLRAQKRQTADTSREQ